jgi:hypothetical protein
MPTLEENERVEYASLMKQGYDAERTALVCWTAGALAAAVTLSWAMAARSSGLMIPVVFAIAVGFYGMLRARQHARWVASYVAEFHEAAEGSQWYTRLQRLQGPAAYRPADDWLTVCLANAGVLLSVILAWVYASGVPRGELMAGIATGCGVVFGFHSISETIRIAQTDSAAMWRQVSGQLREAERSGRTASR